MLTSLAKEQDAVAPFDLDDGALPNFIVPQSLSQAQRMQTWAQSCGLLPPGRGPITGAHAARPFSRSERTLDPPSAESTPQPVP